LRNVSKLSATLSPTASFTKGTSPSNCPLGFRALRPPSWVPSSSSSSSANARASAVRLVGVDLAFGVCEGPGALLGGKERLGPGGEERASKSMMDAW
jgi:hypothetical protein